VIQYSAFSYRCLHISLTRNRYYYAGPTFAVTEVDGVRVIAADACDLIQKVPRNKTFPQNQMLC
jgi:hypothetical protein